MTHHILQAMYLPRLQVEAITAASINPTKRKKQHLNIFKTFLPHWLVAIGLCAIHMSIMLFWTVPSW